MKTQQRNHLHATLATGRTCRSALFIIIERTNAESHASLSANNVTLVSYTNIIYRGTSEAYTVTAFDDRMAARRALSHGSNSAKLNALSMTFKGKLTFDLKELFFEKDKTEKNILAIDTCQYK